MRSHAKWQDVNAKLDSLLRLMETQMVGQMAKMMVVQIQMPERSMSR